ncbi:transporter substrate-binding domain-containing protein [Pseudoduganella sp. FT55W]|uniref:Transporter substrate-binding domain-containing protein n=1 Tax=Duganella rivi TaxID=2666083 RepID=A0A7X4GNI2_9BURK|nr:transporter substrate-binding domain-containing protein [Duganella rivi]MYM65759.1 transporter substrate-binding domain-containing protein [Duganella rivi]
MPRCWPALLVIALAFSAPAAAQGPDTLIFGTTHERGSFAYGYIDEYLQALCAEIRQRCQLQSLPGRRGAAMLADGSIVGELGRVREYSEQHPEYKRIDEPFISLRTYMFTRASRPEINSWDEVANKVRTVSYQRGVYFYQKRLEALRPQVQPHDVQTVTACLQMVLNGRDQACLFDDGSLGEDGKALLPQGRLGRPLDVLNLYLYLGKDHAVLAPSINEAAKRLHAQGLKTRLHRKYIISP